VNKLPRRLFLQGFAGALVALPALEACLPEERPERTGRASSAIKTPAKRLIAIMQPDGVVPAYWFPTGSETSFTLGKHVEKLAPFQDQLIFMKGVDNLAAKNFAFTNGHIEGVTSLLTGLAPYVIDVASNQFSGAGPSIDQVIAQVIRDTGYVPKLSSVNLGEEGGGYGTISYEDVNKESGRLTPNQLFDALFKDQSEDQALKARALKKSILDGTIEDFTRLSKRVSGADKERIDAHLEAVRDIEKRLENSAICAPPMVNLSPLDDDELRTLYYDLLVATMTCDATRVATVAFRHSGGGGPQLPFAGVLQDIHELSHQIVGEAEGGPSHIEFDKYHQWFHGKIAYLAGRMKDVSLPDGKTLLDETVLFQGSEISIDHSTPNMPFYLMAGADTPFHTGRYVEFPTAVPHNHLLVTLARAFGAEIDAFGDPMFAMGNLDDALLKVG
jgi:hypothetical protein